ncbi:dockerin type I domain-containing protein [Microbulbifer sp. 2304DJ12-6]|uniref:dockerin type I domain-containing protein n=1 Tax=Microbulbifer sp. 2304DJ12-6 TaxID=3233340 RepID=UPI0039AEAA0D
MRILRVLLTTATGLLLSLSGTFALAQTFHATMVIDRSGSMTAATVRNGVASTRCKDALSIAKDKINNSLVGGTQISVWTFQNSAYTNRTGGFVSKANAIQAIDLLSAQGCSGSTPLAHTVCSAIDGLELATPLLYRTLWVLSDGEENSSAGLSCGGAGDADGVEPWEPLSWQGRVWQELFPFDVPPYQTAGAGVATVPIYFGVFGDYISLARYSQPVALAGDTPAVSFNHQFAPGDTGGLFNTMAAASGGYVALIDDSSSIPTTSRFDVNGDGCVDQNDLIKMLPYLGKRIPDAPASLDVNGDFVVNTRDYNLVTKNSGLGCK